MPFAPEILDDLARAGASIVIDASTTDPKKLVAIVKLCDRGRSGSLTIRNAGNLPSAELVGIAQVLGGRVTLEE